MKLWLITIGLVAMIALVAYNESNDVNEAQFELDLYCEMVGIRKATNDPLLGWPDYKQIYEEQCITSAP